MGRPHDLTSDEPYVPEDKGILELTSGRRDTTRRGGSRPLAASSRFLENTHTGTRWQRGMSKPEGCLGFRPHWVDNYIMAQEEGLGGRGGRELFKDMPEIEEEIKKMVDRLVNGGTLEPAEMERLGQMTLLNSLRSHRPAVRVAAARELQKLANERGSRREDSGVSLSELEQSLGSRGGSE